MAPPRPPREQRPPADEIKHLYYNATQKTIVRDFDRAIDLLKSMTSEEERERVAVFMDGLSQMRSEWAAATKAAPVTAPPPRPRRRTH